MNIADIEKLERVRTTDDIEALPRDTEYVFTEGLNDSMIEALLRLKRLKILMNDGNSFVTDAGLKILYEPASDVGADRIVDAVAAIEKYGAPCIVVDFGTATTFNVINQQGEYVGGVITPGIMISTDALFERTAKLPRVDIRRPQTVIGSSTITAMQSGLYHGYVGLVDGVLRKMISEIGGTRAPRVIATGGLASLIATGSEFIELVDDTLTLEGLRLIYERTQAKSPKSKVQSPKSQI